jgi:hypothetical protein
LIGKLALFGADEEVDNAHDGGRLLSDQILALVCLREVGSVLD